MLPLTGTIHNSGVIALDSSGDETELQLIEHGVTLDGGGRIVLSDSDENIISGASSGVSLNNVDNTISGAGQIGDGELRLTNAGTIDASGSHVLAIDTGSNIVINSGVLEASGSGGLNVASSIANSGVLWANGSSVVVQGDVSGNGIARIDGAGVLDFEASATANVAFGSGAAGTLKLGELISLQRHHLRLYRGRHDRPCRSRACRSLDKLPGERGGDRRHADGFRWIANSRAVVPRPLFIRQFQHRCRPRQGHSPDLRAARSDRVTRLLVSAGEPPGACVLQQTDEFCRNDVT